MCTPESTTPVPHFSVECESLFSVMFLFVNRGGEDGEEVEDGEKDGEWSTRWSLSTPN